MRTSRGLSTRNCGVALAAGMSMTVHARERSASDIPRRWRLGGEVSSAAAASAAPPEEDSGAPGHPLDAELGGSGLPEGSVGRIVVGHVFVRRLGVSVVADEGVEDRIEIRASRCHLGGQDVSGVTHGRGDEDARHGRDEIRYGCVVFADDKYLIPAEGLFGLFENIFANISFDVCLAVGRPDLLRPLTRPVVSLDPARCVP
jgi:hypothetical protein